MNSHSHLNEMFLFSSIREFELKKPEMLHRTVTSIEECKKMEVMIVW